MGSRHLLIAIVLLLAGLATWSWSRPDPETGPPGAEEPPGGAAPPSSAAPASERSPVATPDPPAAAPARQGTAPAAGAPQGAAKATPNVALRVRDLATRQDVGAFRWRFCVDGHVEQGEGRDGAANLRLPPGTEGQLLVEAAGFTPFVQELVVVADGAPALSIDAFLAPAVAAAGITLLVHDTALRPIGHVRVDAHALTPENRDGTWALGTALWSRRTSAPDGRYTLPDLPPGDYGIRVLATDAEGRLLPLLPYARTFTLTGDNGFVEDVPLEPGCVLLLEVVDAAGDLLDPTALGVTTLSLRLAGGPEVSRRWAVDTAKGPVTALDVLPGAGPTWPAEPLPAGSYELRVEVGGRPRAQRPLVLRGGERQVERLVVP